MPVLGRFHHRWHRRGLVSRLRRDLDQSRVLVEELAAHVRRRLHCCRYRRVEGLFVLVNRRRLMVMALVVMTVHAVFDLDEGVGRNGQRNGHRCRLLSAFRPLCVGSESHKTSAVSRCVLQVRLRTGISCIV